MNVLLATYGTYGDVHPFLGLGRALRRRGHDVTVITSPYFAPQVRAAELELAPVGSYEDYQSFLADPGLWKREESFATLFNRVVSPMLRPVYDAVSRRYVPGETVVVASTLCLGARLAQDKHGVPVATMHVYPGPLQWLAGKPLENTDADWRFAPTINAARAELGLRPVWRIQRRWWDSPLRVICAFPSWFVGAQPHWPAHLRFGGFPLYDEAETRDVPAAVTDFLDAGDPPIAFVPASAGWHWPVFIDAAIAACEVLKCRGLLLTRDAARLAGKLPDHILACEYAPFSRVFPRCRAVVHQGAMGTAALAMAAGVPQVAVPVALDQPDNAEKLRRLGVAATVEGESDALSGADLAKALRELIDEPKIAKRCRLLAARVRGDEALDRTCGLIEDLRGRDNPPRSNPRRKSAESVSLITVGTFGDVHPYVGIARALKSRGHRVRLIASPYFKQMIERAGVEHVPLGTVQDYHDLVGDPDLWSGDRGHEVAAGMCLRMTMAEYDAVHAAHAQDPNTVLLASNFCLGARLAQEALGMARVASVHIAPYSFYHSEDDPAVDRALDALILPRLNRLRDGIGLAPVREVTRQWWESPQRVIGLFPEWFSPIQPGWPAQTRLVGFPFYDESEQHARSEELEAFLADGPPPVAFTPGSGMWFGDSFFRESVEACRQSGWRGVLLTRHHDHVPRDLPKDVIHVHYAPFSQFLPRCAAVVHHAGIGTTAQSLAAGIPQLLMPMSHDQPYNAACVVRLRVGVSLKPEKYKAPAIAEWLEKLRTHPEVVNRCRLIVDALRDNRAVEDVCEIVQGLADGPAEADGDVPAVAAPASRQPVGEVSA